MISIRRRLLVSIFSVLTLGAAVIVVLTFFNAREELTDLLDENMQQVAIAVSMQEPDYQNANFDSGSVLGEQGFCQSCHSYASVKIDCFECHASKPERAAAKAKP